MPMGNRKLSNPSWLLHRETGQRFPHGQSDYLHKGLYNSIGPHHRWEQGDGVRNPIINLGFSSDGSLLVAACERNNILIFDPLSRKLIRSVHSPYVNSVNYAKFLDSRIFGTCGDDSCVNLWDARCLKSPFRTLHGHTNRVRNIEFSSADGLLLSSGYDGNVMAWNLNSYSEHECGSTRVLRIDGLMRMRLNPDASKLILSTIGGYLMVVHDLDLNKLARDLIGFKPNIYRLMQMCGKPIPISTSYNHVFSKTRKSNRVELISDFPRRDHAKVISSLEIHPQGLCAVSRNVARDERSEWTCAHDLLETATSSFRRVAECDSFEESCSSSSSSSSSSDDSLFDYDSEEEAPLPARIRFLRSQRTNILYEFRPQSVNPAPPVEMSVNHTSGPPRLWNMFISGDFPERAEGTQRLESFGGNAAGFSRGDDISRVSFSASVGHLPSTSTSASGDASGAIRRIEPGSANGALFSARGPWHPSTFPAPRQEIRCVGRRVWEFVEIVEDRESGAERSGQQFPGPNVFWNDVNQDQNVSDGSGSDTSTGDEDGDGTAIRRRFSVVIRRNNQEPAVAQRPDAHNALGTNAQGSSSPSEASNSASRNEDVGETSYVAPRISYPSQNLSANIIEQENNAGGSRSGSSAILIPQSRPMLRFGMSGMSRSQGRVGSTSTGLRCFSEQFVNLNREIHQNLPRLSHFIQETCVAQGYTKQMSFSADGRLICSPYDCGIRLLAFSPDCSELPGYPENAAVEFYELLRNVSHKDKVVCTAFSPRHCFLVSGCLGGKIVWYQPIL